MPIRSGTSVPDCITANENLLVLLKFIGSRSVLVANATRKVMKAGTKERNVVQSPVNKGYWKAGAKPRGDVVQ